MYVKSISPNLSSQKKDTCMNPWKLQVLHFSNAWGFTLQRRRHWFSETPSSYVANPNMWRSSILRHLFLTCSSTSAWQLTELSVTTRNYRKLHIFWSCRKRYGEPPIIGLRKSWMSGLQYHITEQLPDIMRITPGSQHPQGFHGNYFRIIINILQEQIHYCVAPRYFAANHFGK